MSKRTSVLMIVGIICVAAALVVNLPLTAVNAQMGRMIMQSRPKTAPLSLEKLHSGHLPMVSASIDKALKAVESGDKKTALAELNMAKKMIAEINLAIGKLVKPKFANARCPIMGSPIKPDKVTKTLIRDYKGEKIAFCCGGCPATWDKLSDTTKAAKLAKVKPTPQKAWTCSMHPQIQMPKQGSCPICNMRLIPASAAQDHTGHKH
jgi:Heavy metal binding domain